jgi:hypothetical protein
MMELILALFQYECSLQVIPYCEQSEENQYSLPTKPTDHENYDRLIMGGCIGPREIRWTRIPTGF